MKRIKPDAPKTTGRTLKEDLERLDDAGINLGGNIKEDEDKSEPEGVPDTKKQQQTGETDRSDRRL